MAAACEQRYSFRDAAELRVPARQWQFAVCFVCFVLIAHILIVHILIVHILTPVFVIPVPR
jgi:uncharacterized protein (DUF983 family)